MPEMWKETCLILKQKTWYEAHERRLPAPAQGQMEISLVLPIDIDISKNSVVKLA